MPLPTNGTSWPPVSAHTQAMAEWSAWYSGDPDQLAAFYQANHGIPTRPAQHAGGVVGKVARWWWGVPPAEGEQRTKLHVPLAADICGTSADLLYSEPLELTGDNDTLQAALAELQDNGLETRLHEGAEVGAALGGIYLRTTWDADVSPMPWLDPVHPDGVVPEFRHGQLRAANLWTELPSIDDGRTYRLIERHESGAIIYRLYAGDPRNLGRVVPLQDHPGAEDLAELVNEDGVQLTDTDRLTLTYLPNMLPNRANRHSKQGRSDLQGVTPLLDALDEAYSSWWRDIRHGKARIHMARQYLETDGPGSAGIADTDREVYVPLDGVMAKPGDGLMIDAQQFAIRVTEHLETCKAWTERAIESAGYSTQSLSSGTGGAVTAAEVHSHERRSYMTRGKKIRYQRAGVREVLHTLVEVANANLSAGIREGDIGVEFPDGVQESPMQLAQTVAAIAGAEAASTQTKVEMLHPEWDSTEVADEVSRILGESGAAPVPFDAGL